MMTDPVRPVAPREDEELAVAMLAACEATIRHLWDIAARFDTKECNLIRDEIHRLNTITLPAIQDLRVAAPVPCAASPADQRWQRLYNIVAHLAHPRGDHRENALEDEAHDLIRALRATGEASWLEPDLKNAYITREQADEYLRQQYPRRACCPNETSTREQNRPTDLVVHGDNVYHDNWFSQYCTICMSMRDRQPPLERAAIDNAIAAVARKATSEIEQLRALVREAFNAGYHCRWTCKEKQYVFDPVLAPGDPDGAYWAWWQQTRPGRLNPVTLEFK